MQPDSEILVSLWAENHRIIKFGKDHLVQLSKRGTEMLQVLQISLPAELGKCLHLRLLLQTYPPGQVTRGTWILQDLGKDKNQRHVEREQHWMLLLHMLILHLPASKVNASRICLIHPVGKWAQQQGHKVCILFAYLCTQRYEVLVWREMLHTTASWIRSHEERTRQKIDFCL